MIVAGDFNKFEINTLLNDFPDLAIQPTDPTRGNQVLDIAITNLGDNIHTHEARPPLVNEDNNAESDYNFMLFKSSWNRSHKFKWIKTTTRRWTKEAIDACTA